MRKYFVLFVLLAFSFCRGGSNPPPASSSLMEHEHKALHVSAEKQIEWEIALAAVSPQSL
jgi:hypothetical protein